MPELNQDEQVAQDDHVIQDDHVVQVGESLKSISSSLRKAADKVIGSKQNSAKKYKEPFVLRKLHNKAQTNFNSAQRLYNDEPEIEAPITEKRRRQRSTSGALGMLQTLPIFKGEA